MDIAFQEGETKKKAIRAAVKAQREEQAEAKPKRVRRNIKKKRVVPEEDEDDDDKEVKVGDEEGEDEEFERMEQQEKESMFPSANAHTKWITGAKLYGPNDTLAISWGKDCKIVLWDLAQQESFTVESAFVKRLAEHNDFIRGVQLLNEEGTDLLSFAKDGSMVVWEDVNSKVPKTTKLIGHSELVLGVKLIDDNKFFLSFARDETIILWELKGANTRAICKLQGHTAWIRGVQLLELKTEEGEARECLLSYSDDHSLKLWDMSKVRAGKGDEALIMTLNGHKAKVMGVMLVSERQSQTGAKSMTVTTHAISYSADSSMIVWNLQACVSDKEAQFVRLKEHSDWVTGVRFAAIPLPNGKTVRRLISWSRDGSFRLWNVAALLNGSKEVATNLVSVDCNLGVLNCQVSRDGKKVLAHGVDSHLIVAWDLVAIILQRSSSFHFDPSLSLDDQAKLPGLAKNGILRASPAAGPVARCVLVDHGQKLVVSQGSTLTLWDVLEGQSCWSITFDTAISTFALASPNKGAPTHVFVGHTDGQVSFLKLKR